VGSAIKRDSLWCWRAIALTVVLSLAGCSHESSDWKSATAADTSEAYQQFLQQHPKSSNAAQAHTRLQQLQEVHDWQVASAADTRDAYEQYVAQHPDSQWTQEARIRIENFAQNAAGGAAPSAAGTTSPAASSPKPAKRNAAAKATAEAPAARYVQLGAYSSQARAESAWKTLSARFPQELKSLTPRYVAGKSHAHSVVRLQVGVATRAIANGMCAKLKKHAQSCVAVSA
jgi:cell division septation protein DedD